MQEPYVPQNSLIIRSSVYNKTILTKTLKTSIMVPNNDKTGMFTYCTTKNNDDNIRFIPIEIKTV